MNKLVNSGRRAFMGGGLACVASTFLPRPALAGAGDQTTVLALKPAPATTRFYGADGPETAVWAYNGSVPGPEIRLRQGGRLEVAVENGIERVTTVHWHGLRIPHAMDGVPDLTQPPIPPGGRFDYAFTVPDAGTYWYHPHAGGAETQARGLYGPLIIEEAEPPRVDRDVTWVIDDWRVDENDAIVEDFGNAMDLSHAGRLGNLATLNGRDSSTFAVRAGERLRLRIINTANARIFSLRFDGHRPQVIALDGQPAIPHEPADGVIVLPPAGRADLIIDMEGRPRSRHPVMEVSDSRQSLQFVELVYDKAKPLRDSPLDATVALPANPIPEPDLGEAARHPMILGGGAMGGMREAVFDGQRHEFRDLARRGKLWALNGIIAHKTDMDPMFVFQRGRTQIITMRNDTAFPHPMHLHGHSYRLLSRNGRPVPHTPWLDTVLVLPDETVDVAFVADNPGDWIFHCHVLEHMEAGMAAVFRVA